MINSKKIKVFLMGRDNVGWSIDSDRKNIHVLLQDSCDFEVINNIFRADIIYSVWYDIFLKPYFFYALKLLKKAKKVKIFAVITNDIRNTPEKIDKLRGFIDVWISPSLSIHSYVLSHGLVSEHIPFLVDKHIFLKLPETRKEIAAILGIDVYHIENKILIGSFQRDSCGYDLLKAKWHKNPDLLIEILRELPKEKLCLILAGPRRHYLINECKKFHIPYIFVGDESFIKNKKDDLVKNNLDLEKINLLYNLIDIYLVTSVSEGGPKAILEASLVRKLIFSTDVGLAKDILSPELIYNKDDIGILRDKILKSVMHQKITESLLDYNQSKVLEALDESSILKKIKKAYAN